MFQWDVLIGDQQCLLSPPGGQAIGSRLSTANWSNLLVAPANQTPRAWLQYKDALLQYKDSLFWYKDTLLQY